MNRKWRKTLGYARKEVIDKSFELFISAEDHKYCIFFNTALQTKSKESIPVEINAHVVQYKGKQAIVCIIRDIRMRNQK